MSAETRCFFVTVFNVNPHARRAYSVRHDLGFAGYFARKEISCAVPSAQSAAASFVHNISDAGDRNKCCRNRIIHCFLHYSL